jgi:hypothetical protein
MDQNIQKALWLGVGILFFVSVVSIGIFLFSKGQAIAENSGKQIDEANSLIGEGEFKDYDNSVVQGSDVVNAINKYKSRRNEVVIVVKTKRSADYQYISTGSVSGTALSGELNAKNKSANDSDIKKANNKNDEHYINPYGEFYAQLIYDENGTIRGIYVDQQ